MTTTLRHDAMTETYHDVHDLICHTVHGFIRRHGPSYGTYDELFAQANWEFMVAFKDYKRKDGSRSGDASFSTWCRWVVSKGLSEHQRNIINRNRRCRITVKDMTDDTEMPREVSEFRLIELLDELSDDATLVAQLTVDTPAGLRDAMRDHSRGSARNIQAVFRQYLYGLDWSAARVTAAFEEITNALE